MTPSSHPSQTHFESCHFDALRSSRFCQGHLADDTGSFETSLEIFHPEQEVERRKNLPVDGVCLLAFGCLNKLIFRGEKNAWILISCGCGKVNEKGANRKSRGSTLSQGFYDCPYVLCPRPNRFILLKMRQAVCS